MRIALAPVSMFTHVVGELAGLKLLTYLNLGDNPDLTKAHIAALQKALPKCRFHHMTRK